MPGALGAPITVTGADGAEQTSPPTPLFAVTEQTQVDPLASPVSVACSGLAPAGTVCVTAPVTLVGQPAVGGDDPV